MSMQAIYLPNFVPDPSNLTPTTVPRPQPRPDDYLIRITHCSPQHADILHAQGKHQNNNKKHGHVHPPFILGYDFAGIVASTPTSPRLGSAHTSSGSGQHGDGDLRMINPPLRNGDRVFGQSIGAFAEYVAVPATRIRRIPEGLSSEIACAMVGEAVSYAAVTSIAKLQPGETVMVSGASGGLGSVCCMVAKALGAKVIALAGNAEKADKLRSLLGVDLAVDISDGHDWIGRVQHFTHGSGVDVVIDNTGMVNDSIKCLGHFGRIVILGFAGRNGVMEDVKMNKLLLKSVTVTGYRFGESGRRRPAELERIWNDYIGMLRSGRLSPIVLNRYDGLENIGAALDALHHRRAFGKIVVAVAPESEKSRL